jgi:hypothetical protein
MSIDSNVVRQHHPGVDVERMARPRGANGAARRVDLGDQQIRASITQIDRKEATSAPDTVAPVLGHRRSAARHSR